MGRVRSTGLASLICATSLLALPAVAAAAPTVLERAAIRQALRAGANGSAASVLRLPLPGRPRPQGHATGRQLASLARDRAPGRLLVGLSRHRDLNAVRSSLAWRGARVRAIEP